MFRAIVLKATATTSATACALGLERKASGVWLFRTNFVANGEAPYSTNSTSTSGQAKGPSNGHNVVDGTSWTTSQDYAGLSSGEGSTLNVQGASTGISQADIVPSGDIISTVDQIVQLDDGPTAEALSRTVDETSGTSIPTSVSELSNSETNTAADAQHVRPPTDKAVPTGEFLGSVHQEAWEELVAKLDISLLDSAQGSAEADGASRDIPGNQEEQTGNGMWALPDAGTIPAWSTSATGKNVPKKTHVTDSESMEFSQSNQSEPVAEVLIARTKSLAALQEQIEYKFKNPKWLVWAISRTEAVHSGEYIPDMQRYLAIIGDSVLKGAYYIQNFPYQHLSALHGPFAKISSNDALAGIMFDSGLLQLIYPGPHNGYIVERIATWSIATMLEAIVGAVYMDSGKDYVDTRSVIESILELAGINAKDGSPLDASNCGQRETFSPLNCRMIDSVVHAELPTMNSGLPVYLSHKDLVIEQTKFVTLRKVKAKLQGATPPRDYILKKVFRQNLLRFKDFKKVLGEEKDEIAELQRRAKNGSLLKKRVSDQSDCNDLKPGDKNYTIQLQPRPELLDTGLMMAKTEQEFQVRRRRVESILGYTFQDADILKMSTSNESFVHKDRNVPNPQEHLAHLGSSILRLVFYQHNLSHRGYGPELRQIYIAVSSTVNLAYIFENLGLFKASFANARSQGIRADLKSPTPLIKTLAITLEAMLGAVWLDSGSNYLVIKSVIEKILWQKGDEGKAGSPLDWQRVLGRRNAYWPGGLRRNSPLREHFSKDDIEFDEVELTDPT